MSEHPPKRRLVIHSNAERDKTRAARNTRPPRKRLVGWDQYLWTGGKKVLLKGCACGLICLGAPPLLLSVYDVWEGLLNLVHLDTIGAIIAVICGLIFFCPGFLCMWVSKTLFATANEMEAVAPITRRATSSLPPEETLLRAADLPLLNYRAELLRAAGQLPETPPEELLRATSTNESGRA